MCKFATYIHSLFHNTNKASNVTKRYPPATKLESRALTLRKIVETEGGTK